MPSIKGVYRLIDVISIEYNDKVYYFGNVYYTENGQGDLLRVSCKQEDIRFLQQHLNQDVSELIKIRYNKYKKCFVPYFECPQD